MKGSGGMKDYTYQDMLKMQEEAAQRVREMKKRASIAVENDKNDEIRINSENSRRLPDEVRRISYPVELSAEKEETPPKDKPADGKDTGRSGGGLMKLLLADKDAALIFTLLAVVSQNGDNLISFALLYLLL